MTHISTECAVCALTASAAGTTTPLDDGRVSCSACKRSSHPAEIATIEACRALPEDVRNLVISLVGAPESQESFRICRVTDGMRELAAAPDFAERAAAAVAHGYDGSVFDEVSIALGIPPYNYQTVKITYRPEDLESAAAATRGPVDLQFLNQLRAPRAVWKAVGELVTSGFRPVDGVDPYLGSVSRRLLFKKGVDDGSKVLRGIRAEVGWIVL